MYGLGKSFLWPTSLGLVAEQFRKSGALCINVIAGVCMLAVGILGSVFLGAVQDRAVGEALTRHDQVSGTELHARFFTLERRGLFGPYRSLDEVGVAEADPASRDAVTKAVATSKREALQSVAVLPLIMLGVYLVLIVWFRGRGGYAAELPARGSS